MRRIALAVFLVGLVATTLGLPASRPATADGPGHHSHFRYTHISWEAGSGVNTADVVFTAGFRRDAYFGNGSDGMPVVGDVIDESIGGTTLCFGDGACTGTLRFKVFAYNAVENWILARGLQPGTVDDETITHAYSGPGPWTGYSQSCCRVSRLSSTTAHLNNPDGNYRAEFLVNFNSNSGSPKSLLPPIVQCRAESLCSFEVTASDDDERRLRFRLSSSSEAGPGFVQPGAPESPHTATIGQSTGRYTWDTEDAAQEDVPINLYSTQVTIEELDATGHVVSKSAVDFFIRLTTATRVGPDDVLRIPVRWCGIEGDPALSIPHRPIVT